MESTLNQRRLTPAEQHEQMVRLGFCDGGRYVVEPDGTFRPMTPADVEDALDLQEYLERTTQWGGAVGSSRGS